MSDGVSGEQGFEVGAVIGGRYEVLDPTPGNGALRARDREGGQEVALLALPLDASDPAVLEGVIETLGEAMAIKQRGLAEVVGLEREGEALFVVEAWVEGQTLAAFLAERRAQRKALSFTATFNMMSGVCRAVRAVHKAGCYFGALTHRRVLVDGRGAPRVSGLAQALIMQRHGSEAARGAYFAPPFCAPELRDGKHAPGPQADVFSLGVLSAEMLSSEPVDAWGGEPVAFVEEVVAGRSGSLQDLLLSAVLPVVIARPESVEAFERQLEEALDAPEEGAADAEVMRPAPPPVSSVMPAPPRPPPPRSGPPRKKPGSGVISGLSAAPPPPKRGIGSSVSPVVTASQVGDAPPPPKQGMASSVSSVVTASQVGDAPPPPKQGGAFFGAPEPRSNISSAVSAIVNINADAEEEVWLVEKDGLDYGPFALQGVLDMLHKDEVDEHASVLHLPSGKRHPMEEIAIFRPHVLDYLPVRAERRRKEEEERQRRVHQVKQASGVGGAVTLGFVLFSVVSGVIAYLQLPAPEPTDFQAGVIAFPHAFEMPKPEEVKLDVVGDTADLFGGQLSEEELLEKQQAWYEQKRQEMLAAQSEGARSRARSRRRRPSRASRSASSSASSDDDFDDVVTEMNMDEDVPPLDDIEIFDVIYAPRTMSKINECAKNHGGGQGVRVEFWISPTGSISKIRTNRSGAYDACVKGIFNSVRFREFGGAARKVGVSYG